MHEGKAEPLLLRDPASGAEAWRVEAACLPSPSFIPHCRSSYKLIHSDNKSAARLLQHARRALAINLQIPSVMRGRWGRRAREVWGAATVILCNWQVGLIFTHRVLYSRLGKTVNRMWEQRQGGDGRVAHLQLNTVVCDLPTGHVRWWTSPSVNRETRAEGRQLKLPCDYFFRIKQLPCYVISSL